MKLKQQTVFLVRHAHRDKPMGGRLDNGLSEKGRKQVKRLARSLGVRLKEFSSIEFVSSPKKRCQETLKPLAKKAGVSLQTLSSLNVTTDSGISKNVKKTQQWMRSTQAEVLVLGVHGEWTEAFFKAVLGIELSLDKSGWAELSLGPNAEFTLLALVPESLNG